MTRKIAVEQVQKTLDGVYAGKVKIRPETYTGVSRKATFVDEDYGEWTTWTMNVVQGHGHYERGKKSAQATNLVKYGSISPLGNKVIQEKAKVTNKVRYGDEHIWGANSSVRAEIVEGWIETFGVDNPMKNEEVHAKAKATHMERHGAEYPYQVPAILQKAKDTTMEHYGVENAFQSEEVRERSKQTCIERYGVENPAQSPEVQKRTAKSQKKVTLVKHWKTGEELACTASYEVAVVKWLNDGQVDFDWQVPLQIPKDDVNADPIVRGKTYFVDLHVKSGELTGLWAEIKGTFNRKNGHIGKAKWEWLNQTRGDKSRLWTKDVLIGMGILKGKVK